MKKPPNTDGIGGEAGLFALDFFRPLPLPIDKVEGLLESVRGFVFFP
jgi:hypothetical protein